jgi:putative FmdB family regulatory protein
MPIYEYRCSSCGYQKEYLQKINDPVLTVCPECSKNTFSKMLTAAGFQLKGSGWYATDFKNSKPATKSASETKSDAKPDTKSDGKTESKSDGKTDSKPAKTESKPAKTESKSESVSCGAGACPSCS